MRSSLGSCNRGLRRFVRPPFLSLLALIGLSASASAIEQTYRYFRFTQKALRGPTPNSIQLSEFVFLHAGAPVSLTGMTVTNPGGDSPPQNNPTPGTEEPVNLKDLNLNTKWLDFNKAPVVFDFGTATTIDGYNFATANDAQERDPVSWTLEGSDDNATWTLIDAINNYPTTTARKAYAVADTAVGFALPTTLIASFTSSKQIILDSETLDFSWSTIQATSATLTPAPGTVPTTGTQNVDPPAGADTTYTLTADGPGGAVSQNLTIRSVAGGTAHFRYARFTPIKVRSGVPGGVQLSELRFRSNITVLTPAVVTNPGGTSGAGEGPDKLNDNNTATKWFNNGPQPLVYDFGVAVDFDNYYFATANDTPDRDPLQWILEGSDDQTTWTLIDNVTGIDFNTPLTRFTQVQNIPLPGSSLAPYIQSFVGDAPKVISGQPLLLTWSSMGGTTFTIDNSVGAVPASGSISVVPTADTTYTLTVSSPSGTTTATFDVVLVQPEITTINYSNFDAAGDELMLLQSASVVNDFANIPQPGDFNRLRITDNAASRSGYCWFGKRMNLAAGFRNEFDFQYVNFGANEGADGMAFVIQNSPLGTALTYNEAENGAKSNALSISFDSFDNDGAAGTAEPSSAFVRVRAGTNILATTNLAPLLSITDLTSNTGNVAPYRVRVDYVPGDLDVYVNEIPVVSNLSVNLSTIGAVDAGGKGYVGFSARNGGFYENHDVTRWVLTEGAPAGPLILKNWAINLATQQLQLTWYSVPTKTYKVTSSTDLAAWTTVLGSGIPGAAGTETSTTVSFVAGLKGFFRVEEE